MGRLCHAGGHGAYASQKATVEAHCEAAGTQDMSPSMTMMLDVPRPGQGLHVRLHLEHVMDSVPIEIEDSLEETIDPATSSVARPITPAETHANDDGVETDEVDLMQTQMYGRGICTLADLKQWLESISTPYRILMVEELLGILRSRQSVMDVCVRYLESVRSPASAGTQAEGELPRYVEVAMQSFVNDLMASEEESQPLQIVGEGAVLDVTPRRRRTATSSTSVVLPHAELSRAAGTGIMDMAAVLVGRVRDMVRDGEAEDYRNTMRLVVQEFTRQVNIRSSRLRVLLLVLAELLPQPMMDGTPTSQSQLSGVDVFYEILNVIDSMDLTTFQDTESYMDHDWAVANGGPLSMLGIDLMSFGECALRCRKMICGPQDLLM